ncbi:MAG TPA: DUF3107 domain-containing protein [Acidimicrobiia bacterium]|nr:DUF3107 domain-containing protein [Acidimicrobiia bacterium]
MEIRIGVVFTPKELTLEPEGAPDDVVAMVEKALKDGAAMIWFEDVKGHRVGVPADKLGYIEVDSDEGSTRVGFGSS